MDNTNISSETRARWIAIAKSEKIQVRFYFVSWMTTYFHDCIFLKSNIIYFSSFIFTFLFLLLIICSISRHFFFSFQFSFFVCNFSFSIFHSSFLPSFIFLFLSLFSINTSTMKKDSLFGTKNVERNLFLFSYIPSSRSTNFCRRQTRNRKSTCVANSNRLCTIVLKFVSSLSIFAELDVSFSSIFCYVFQAIFFFSFLSASSFIIYVIYEEPLVHPFFFYLCHTSYVCSFVSSFFSFPIFYYSLFTFHFLSFIIQIHHSFFIFHFSFFIFHFSFFIFHFSFFIFHFSFFIFHFSFFIFIFHFLFFIFHFSNFSYSLFRLKFHFFCLTFHFICFIKQVYFG